jgi:hypothetical protein
MNKIPATTYAALLRALKRHRNARRAAAKVAGVNQTTAWRIARKNGIELISRAEHMRKRRREPAFRRKQARAAAKGASRWLKSKHRNEPAFHRKMIEAARANLTRLNEDPSFRRASAERLRALYADPKFRRKQARAASKAMRRRHARLGKRARRTGRKEDAISRSNRITSK